MFRILILLITFLSIKFSIHIEIIIFQTWHNFCCIINQYGFLKELKMCLHEFSLVDDTMEAIGSPKKYQRLRKWIIRIIIGYITYVFYQLASCAYIQIMYYYLNYNCFVITCRVFLFSYRDFVHIASVLIWGTILRLVYLWTFIS